MSSISKSLKINTELVQVFESRIEKESKNKYLSKIFTTYLFTQKQQLEVSKNNTYFFDVPQKNIHKKFDKIYLKGIEILAKHSLRSETQAHLSSDISTSQVFGKALKTSQVAMGGILGWLFGLIFVNRPMTNLILHEYGHKWAAELLHNNSNPYVSTNAQYWFDKGDWKNFFAGSRNGAPGNWTRFEPKDPSQSVTLTHFGKSLTPEERRLFTIGAGLGVELIANTLIASMGLLAIKKKKKTLGAFLLGFFVISHSGSGSYIRRYQHCSLEQLMCSGGDPPILAFLLSDMLGCSPLEAFRAMNVGYALFPIVLLGAISLLFMKRESDIPEELVLARLLTTDIKNLKESDPQYEQFLELRKMFIELELEMGKEIQEIKDLEKQGSKLTPEQKRQLRRKSKLLAGKIFEKLVNKIHENKKTEKLYKTTHKEMLKELKGNVNSKLPTSYYLRIIAGLSSLLAYGLISISHTVLPTLAKAFYYLSGIYIIAQVLSSILNIIQTINDLKNDKLSQYAKILSVARTAIGLVIATLITVALFTTSMTPIILPLLIGGSLVSFALAYLQQREMKRLAKFYELIKHGGLWDNQKLEAHDLLIQIQKSKGKDIKEKYNNLLTKRADESIEEYHLRLQEMDQSMQWLKAQDQALKQNLLNKKQQASIKSTMISFTKIKDELSDKHLHFTQITSKAHNHLLRFIPRDTFFNQEPNAKALAFASK